MNINLQNIYKQLQSNDLQTVIDAIKLIRKNGDSNSAIPLLECYFNTESEQVKELILLLFQDMRDVEFAKVWADNIEKYIGAKGFNEVLSCAWMSPVDLSSKLMVFAKIIVKANFIDAVEALSVIEQNMHNLNAEENEELEKYLKQNFKSLSIEKKSLIGTFIDPL